MKNWKHCTVGAMGAAEAAHLEDIAARGTIRIGTTGDYRPMSYLDQATGQYEGFDAALAQKIADSLHVKVEYVPTTWKTLAADTQAGKFDIAICGITRTYDRARTMEMSDGYLVFGKTILCRDGDAAKWSIRAERMKNSLMTTCRTRRSSCTNRTRRSPASWPKARRTS